MKQNSIKQRHPHRNVSANCAPFHAALCRLRVSYHRADSSQDTSCHLASRMIPKPKCRCRKP
ncbi:Protein of unknown function [Pyronema omphalodes CBS 100304]|uniref:Uncharacterized protein n=1 Tax=Pyronema omphalodes (strain CBS 100304) TaxID=1076935 RepID=U4LXQ1_PYROM|nr:Protein of unknown function [Pyronema omphalodes CBS 100304]